MNDEFVCIVMALFNGVFCVDSVFANENAANDRIDYMNGKDSAFEAHMVMRLVRQENSLMTL